MARTTTAHMFSSANGVSEAPDRFQHDAFGEAEGEMMGRTLAGVTDVVMGRALWQEWSEYWSAAGDADPFGSFINPVRKHVISSTLAGELGWNSTLVEGDPVTYVRDLKAADGGPITVAGGVETVRSLFLAGVVDRLILTVHPAITGEGRRLFDDSVPLTRLTLVEGTTTPAGNAVLTYALRAD
ncbi:dihydrofolate reductase family protein [Iamia majanohamensis]|uniref:Dihydrofolate reductase family protein n=1 Tax=Iamia majanohamensis TaxID=467976 RepID=A0AAE9YAP2_9ACTN|nr:dihydrofolate reductase family protein [Iamia majanohamensis]WCO68956.1 dihydrofolate reductase family protein [Iamia majanohamensis]